MFLLLIDFYNLPSNAISSFLIICVCNMLHLFSAYVLHARSVHYMGLSYYLCY